MPVPFKSEVDWSPESWFSNRVKTVDGSRSWSDQDAKILSSHVPEYNQIEQNSKANGSWLKMEDGSTYTGDPREWIMMQSQAYKKNFQPTPWYSGQAYYRNSAQNKRFGNGTMWFSNHRPYAEAYAYVYDKNGDGPRYAPWADKDSESYRPDLVQNPDDEMREEMEQQQGGHVFVGGIPKQGNFRTLINEGWSHWKRMPYELNNGTIQKVTPVIMDSKKTNANGSVINTRMQNDKKVLTDDVVNWSRQLKDDGIFFNNVDDGPSAIYHPNFNTNKENHWSNYRLQPSSTIIDEFISHPGFTEKMKFINGNNGDFDINNKDKYAYNETNRQINYVLKGGKLCN